MPPNDCLSTSYVLATVVRDGLTITTRLVTVPEDEGLARYVWKEYQFTDDRSWHGITAITAQLERLQAIEHPFILNYQEVIPAENGFTLVREYVEAQPLTNQLKLDEADSYAIVLQLIEVLVYLQKMEPPLIHGNIKPNNVLVDNSNSLYLVDFAIDYCEPSRKELMELSKGFFAPECWQNKNRNLATDLYSAGAVLGCWFSDTHPQDIAKLYQGDRLEFNLNDKSTEEWLNQLLKPTLKYRTENAITALNALLALTDLQKKIVPRPQVYLRHGRRNYRLKDETPHLIVFNPKTYGGKLTYKFTISNTRHTVQLNGQWEIEERDRSWISIEPDIFNENEVRCLLTVNTDQLQERTTYDREIFLITNGDPEVSGLPIKLNTAKYAVKPKRWISVGAVGIIIFFTALIFINSGDLGGLYSLAFLFVPILYRFGFLIHVGGAGGGIYLMGTFIRALGPEVGQGLVALGSSLVVIALATYVFKEAILADVIFYVPIAVIAGALGTGMGIAFLRLGGQYSWLVLVFSLLVLLSALFYPNWQVLRKNMRYRHILPTLIKP